MYICLFMATLVLAAFVFLIATAGSKLGDLLKRSLIDNNNEIIKSSRIELDIIVKKVKRLNERATTKREVDPKLKKRVKQLRKKIKTAEDQNKSILKNGVSLLDIPALAGYRLISMLGLDNNNEFVSSTYNKCCQFKEKTEAKGYTYYVIANLFGNIVLGVGLFFLSLGIGIGLDIGSRAAVFAIVLLAIPMIIGYIPYSDVDYTIQQRRDSIEHDFPRVVSKLTLLTVSGMEVNSAWNLTAESENGTLYSEMMRVRIDLNNNVPAAEAYERFIKRCCNQFTTKLATSIMQNAVMGNGEIVRLLSELNKECWSEYKHTARRKGEAISNKLLIPTLLMFGGILVIIIVPAMGGFNI